jgi:hypothetical protein
VYWENDSFVRGGGTDELYTNGIRFSLGRIASRNWPWVDSLGGWWRTRSPLARRIPHVTSSALIFGQNFFTPTEITTYDVDPQDRPYAGLLYGGVHIDVTESGDSRPTKFQFRVQHSFEGAVGMLGPAALAGPTQSAVHVLRQNRLPKGWDNQLPNEPAAFASYMWRARMGVHYADVVPHWGVTLGNPQTLASAGATFRLGWNMSAYPALLLPQGALPAAKNRDLEFGLLAGFEGRAFARNASLEGNLLRESPSVDVEHLVADLRLGLTLRVTDWRLSYTFVRRTPEIAGDGPYAGLYHNFGSVTFGYEPSTRTATDRQGTCVGKVVDSFLGTGLRHFIFEASAGSGRSLGDDNLDQNGRGMHISVGRGFGRYLAVTWEMTGIAREAPQPAAASDDHKDTFLVNKPFALRVRPFPGTRWLDQFHVRAGTGGASVTTQLTPGVRGPRTTACASRMELSTDSRRCTGVETARGTLLGAGYGYGLSRSAAVGVDVAWNKFNIGQSRGFVAWTFGIGWHP